MHTLLLSAAIVATFRTTLSLGQPELTDGNRLRPLTLSLESIEHALCAVAAVAAAAAAIVKSSN